jgi:UDP-N-acetylglucosamine 2-epimerase (non-hydrolysing)
MKIAPILSALRSRAPGIQNVLVHTGQHYDERMSALFFRQLGIPLPDVNLEVGSASHAEQTAEIMRRFEKVCLEQRPTHVLVVGDVNSTIACALVAAKLSVAVVHVEAGLRSFDRRMPEEINRILTDAISDILFTTEQSANENLRREGVPAGKVRFVGNVMIDTLVAHRQAAAESRILASLGLMDGDGRPPYRYGVLTLHRAETVDDPETLRGVLDALEGATRRMPVIFPVHPRTRSRIEAFGLGDRFRGGGVDGRHAGEAHPAGDPREGGPAPGIVPVEPLGYLDFLRLMSEARLVLTDSGGIQEETTILGVPCVTLRRSTERPVTVTHGTNIVAGTGPEQIAAAVRTQMERGGAGECPPPPLWDGRAAERIADVLSGKEME